MPPLRGLHHVDRLPMLDAVRNLDDSIGSDVISNQDIHPDTAVVRDLQLQVCRSKRVGHDFPHERRRTQPH